MTDPETIARTPETHRTCPMCAGKARQRSEYDNDGAYWVYVECVDCGIRTRGNWVHQGNDCPQFRAEQWDEWDRRVDAATIAHQSAELERMRKALHDAATSLETISLLAGKKHCPEGIDTFMDSFIQTRAFASNRAVVARAALAARNGGDL